MDAFVDVTTWRLETERLMLRPWREEDLEDFYRYASVPGVGEMAGWAHHENREKSAAILKLFMDEKKTLALEEKATGRVIGSLGLEPTGHCEDLTEDWRGREIGYVLAKDRWGQGLMPEAVRAVIAECFGAQDFDFLTCGHFLRNRQSRRVIEKCGFSYWKDILFRTRMGTEEPTRLYLLKNTEKGDIHV